MSSTSAPLYRSVNLAGQITPKGSAMPNPKARNLAAAQRSVEILDKNADLGPEDFVRPETLPTGGQMTLDTNLKNVALWLSKLLAEHHGPGSWNASYRLRHVEEVELRGMLICLGASPFLIEQWLDEIRSLVVSFSYRAGVN